MKVKLKISALILLAFLQACSSGSKNVLEPSDFNKQLEANPNAVVIDVRSPEEYAMGYIPGAKNINVNAPDFRDKVSVFDKDKTLYVYCKSGSRSATAADILMDLGYSKIRDLDGGILAWEGEGLELEGKKEPPKVMYTMASFNEEVKASNLVLVDFYADWCGPCKRMAPHVSKMKQKYGDALTIIKVDTDKSPEVSKNFDIRSIPLVKVYKNGSEVYDRIGYHSEEELDAILQKHL